MKDKTKAIFNGLFERYPALEPCREQIKGAFGLLRECYSDGGKLLCCGNGGSCADCDHIVGELMKSFRFKRPIPAGFAEKLKEDDENGESTADGKFIAEGLENALPAISLCGHNALTTAFLNDTEPRLTFAQQLYGLGRKGDVLLAISTSGSSKNCVYAAITAKAMGIRVIALTGRDGGKLKERADISVIVPADETYKIQEYHLPVYHCLCAMLEQEFFGE